MSSDLPIIQISYNGRADPDGIDTKTQYLIITPTEFLSIVEPLAAWKTQKGVYTSIAVLDGSNGINSTYFGHDLAAKIHPRCLEATLEAQFAWDFSGPIPWHPGAIRFFKEKGVWTAEMETIQKRLLNGEYPFLD